MQPTEQANGPATERPSSARPSVRRANRERIRARRMSRHAMAARLVGRHQTASFVTSCVDYGMMILLVQAFGVSAVLATIAGAFTGGVTNFTLSRAWVFTSRGRRRAQAPRYAIVSLVSLALNAVGVYALHDRLGLHYVVARVCVSVSVSLLWNLPLQRYFVFTPQPTRQ